MLRVVLPLLLTVLPGVVLAQEPLPTEELKVEQSISPDKSIFLAHGNWGGAGSVDILSADDLSYKGNIGTGLLAQVVLSEKGREAHVVSSYPRRIVSGPADIVVQRYDVATLKAGPETIIPDKFALTHPAKGILELTSDKRFALVQNATPATSVAVVDLKSRKAVAEAPTPGCWSIIPASEGRRFSSLCGDGTLLTVSLGANGRPTGQTYSAPVFDADKDPVFAHSLRDKAGNLIFLSFAGDVRRVSDASEKAVLVDHFSLVGGDGKGWAPGGAQAMAYNAANDVLFVLMHEGADEGSHKRGSDEIWAVSLSAKRVLYKSPAKGFTHLGVTADAMPVLFATSRYENKVARFVVDPEAKFAAKATHTITVANVSYVAVP